ncbi:MAG: auxin-regulated protein [Rhodospirillales bacterium]|nr:MAG: auxin-regulated protein [Rhodospirillales bacterium]
MALIDATPLIRLYARYRLAALRRLVPAAVQRRQLMNLIATAKDTRFGRDHGFIHIRSVEAFQNQVPLRKYEDFWETYWKHSFPRLTDLSWPGTIPFFAKTSGTTTGITKYIPCSRPMIRSNIKAGIDLFVHHVANRPHSRILGGQSFLLGGSTDLRELDADIYVGDISGILAQQMPWWTRGRYFPPESLTRITDWDEKIGAIAKAIQGRDIRTIGGAPSWLLVFFERLAAEWPAHQGRLGRFFPHLEMLVHGGVNIAPYRPMFGRLLEGSHAETREVYPASEGFIAVADRGDGEGLRLMLDSGIFYEFVPVEELGSERPTRHWIETVEKDVNYAIAVSTCAGCWGYLIGDTIRFVDLDPPRLLITGRTSYSLSSFGEHLIGEEIEDAVARAAQEIGTGVNDFSVGALFAEQEGDVGRHLFIVEFADGVPSEETVTRFTGRLDELLAESNDDYRVHRHRDSAMKAPKVHAVEPGTFAEWMRQRGQIGGQHKVPRVINDQDLFRDLRGFVGAD